MASLKGFDPAQSGQKPVDNNGNPVPVGVWGDSTSGVGVFGTSDALTSNQDNIPIRKVAGVTGHSLKESGVRGESIDGEGVVGRSKNFIGVHGVAADTRNAGVFGESAKGGVGVRGLIDGETGIGVHGTSGTLDPFRDLPPSAGVFGDGGLGDRLSYGVYGISEIGEGVRGDSTSNTGVHGVSEKQFGVFGFSLSSIGVKGVGTTDGVVGVGHSFGVYGSWSGPSDPSGDIQGGVKGEGRFGVAVGVFGDSDMEDGVRGHGQDAGHAGVAGLNFGSGQGIFGWSASGLAGDFNGKVRVTGTIVHAFASSKIDHPLDPENRYLYHSSVQSPDMLNVYNGNTTTDHRGDAIVKMPDYFAALNQDFRYQLTVIEQFAHAIVASEIKDNKFMIKTDMPHVKVSWMVTGVRQDTYAKAHRISVEEDKPAEERGRYLHPELWGQPKEAGIVRWSSQPQNQLHEVSHPEPEQVTQRREKATET